jgi:hypothetical protein
MQLALGLKSTKLQVRGLGTRSGTDGSYLCRWRRVKQNDDDSKMMK